MKLEIEEITARQIFDSRGIPTVETEITLTNGISATVSVPSGASTGSKEAVELRDKNPNEYLGKGVKKAVNNINEIISPFLKGRNPSEQEKIDNSLLELDGTINKSNLGANTILAVSLACARVSAKAYNLPLFRYLGGVQANIMPIPMMNIINGGMHTNNNLDFQEFMIVPIEFKTFAERMKAGVEIFHNLKCILDSRNLSTNVGDEGGFAPELSNPKVTLDLIIDAIEKSGYNTNMVKIALDVAASSFYELGDCCGGVCEISKYKLKNLGVNFTTDEMIDYLASLVKTYPIISIEDGLSENDVEGWYSFTRKMSGDCMLVGDDLFVTNSEKLLNGIKRGLGNAIIIKPNQVGTLTETLQAIAIAKKHNYKTIVSHRSGETEDTFVADLAVAVNSSFVKFGSVSRTDRMCKYNRLLKIEEEL